MIFKYLSFLCEQDRLEAKLNELGAQGWRLHTCDPVVPVGQYGSGTLNAFVVMDMLIQTEEETEQAEEAAPGGIAMRG